jgi:hypothetical protein
MYSIVTQLEKQLDSQQRLVDEYSAKNAHLTQKLEATHSELSQKLFDAQRDVKMVITLCLPSNLCCCMLAGVYREHTHCFSLFTASWVIATTDGKLNDVELLMITRSALAIR